MGSKLGQMLLLFGAVTIASAEESSSSFSFLTLPDSLTEELMSTAQSGFGYGFGLATAFILGSGGIVLILHLINRGAGR